MGLCESKEQEHQTSRRQQSYQRFESPSQNPSYLEQGNNLPCKYETVIIQDNLKTIAEESTIQQDRQIQYQSTAPSPQASVDGRQVEQQIPLMIQNPSSTWNLQSHVIKLGGLYDVSVGQEHIGQYDEWEFISDHDGPLQNQDRVVLRHRLTNTLLAADEGCKGHCKVGCIPNKGIKEEVMWQIEIGSDSLYENTFVKFRHIKSRLFLTRTSENATMDDHRKVVLSKFDPINSFWFVKLK